MNYPNGENIKVGDKVGFGAKIEGEVVCIIDTGEYSIDYPEAQWGYLKRGVLINFSSKGLIHYETELEPDLRLIARTQ